MCEDVTDLSHSMHMPAVFDQPVEQCRLGRQHGEVTPVSGTLEGRGGLTDKGSGDDAADIVGIEQPPGQTAKRQQAIEAEMLLVRCDLEDGIRGRVADRLAGADMVLAEPGDDLRSRGCLLYTSDAADE